LYLSGTRLLSEAQFGKWNLPPDWLLVSETEPPSLPQEFDPVYGYNAVRIPLYLYWGGDTQKSLYQPFIDWAVHDENIYQLPDIINLVTNSPGDYTALPGMIAIYHLIAPRQITDSGNTGENYASYYSACLRLLCTVAEKESRTYSALPRP
jgi:endoglucanase